MSDAPRAVFLSYAREDADAARRIAGALRAFGVEVWFDQSELRGGDAWDQKIRTQIKACALFVPIVSGRTEERSEGYFRREWRLAIDRMLDMGSGRTFIVPVAIDQTREDGADVPEEFRRYHWTRLPDGAATPEFVEQVKRLLESKKPAPTAAPKPPGSSRPAVPQSGPAATAGSGAYRPLIIGALAAFAVAAAIYLARRPAVKEEPVAGAPPEAGSTPVAASDKKSIAVLPFANLSTDKENEFFADGVQDDVITNLAKIRDLTVISRTSTLAYRDTAARNLKKIAAELNVTTILEGSVRRVGSKVHMNAQLIDARTDAHLWADTFDGDAGDIFALQASLAQKIAAALKATLTPGERTLIERRPTPNSEAYGLYLRAKALEDLLTPRSGLAKYEQAAALYAQATALDPAFALAFSRLTYLHAIMYWFGSMDPTPVRRARAQAALEATERVSPTAPEAHIARGTIAYFCDNDWQRALVEYGQAEASLPNDSRLESLIAYAHRRLGHWPEAVRHLQRALELNPADFYNGTQLVNFLKDLRQTGTAHELARRMQVIVPGDNFLALAIARVQFETDGDRGAYLRALATLPPADDDPAGFRAAYRQAYWSGNLAEADRVLSDPRFTSVEGLGQILNDSPALHRALIARLRGQDVAEQRFADEAITWYRAQSWPPRQQPFVALAIARAKAFAGRTAEALPELKAAIALTCQRDAYGGVSGMCEAGRAYLALGRPDEALAILRTLMSGPSSFGPNEFRLDPFWSRLKDDPRFEEILKSAKPL